MLQRVSLRKLRLSSIFLGIVLISSASISFQMGIDKPFIILSINRETTDAMHDHQRSL